jgi:solute carrier family 35 (adenosine 3'-phospho 5'-phosphosulfate transporter), member B3
MQNYAIIAVFMVATMGLSNTSLNYLNYPTQVLFKSCKLIPVMIGGIILLKKRYVMMEYMSAILLCAGLVEITLGNAYV